MVNNTVFIFDKDYGKIVKHTIKLKHGNKQN